MNYVMFITMLIKVTNEPSYEVVYVSHCPAPQLGYNVPIRGGAEELGIGRGGAEGQGKGLSLIHI